MTIPSNVTNSRTIEIWKPLTVADLGRFVSNLPADAELRFTHIPRDRPFDPEGTTIKATWKDATDA